MISTAIAGNHAIILVNRVRTQSKVRCSTYIYLIHQHSVAEVVEVSTAAAGFPATAGKLHAAATLHSPTYLHLRPVSRAVSVSAVTYLSCELRQFCAVVVPLGSCKVMLAHLLLLAVFTTIQGAHADVQAQAQQLKDALTQGFKFRLTTYEDALGTADAKCVLHSPGSQHDPFGFAADSLDTTKRVPHATTQQTCFLVRLDTHTVFCCRALHAACTSSASYGAAKRRRCRSRCSPRLPSTGCTQCATSARRTAGRWPQRCTSRWCRIATSPSLLPAGRRWSRRCH